MNSSSDSALVENVQKVKHTIASNKAAISDFKAKSKDLETVISRKAQEQSQLT